MRTINIDYLIEHMDYDKHIYLETPLAKETYTRSFKYCTEDQILLSFAMDKLAMASDCFILYAIDYFGCAGAEVIVRYLQILKEKGSELSIPSGEALYANVKSRLRVLYDRGLVFRHMYKIGDAQLGANKQGFSNDAEMGVFYTVSDTAHHILRQRLRKDGFLHNVSLAYKSLNDLCGWAAAAYVGVNLMGSERYVGELERVFKTKYGQVFYPAEIKTKALNGQIFYIAVCDGNFLRDESSQTHTQYEEWVRNKTDDMSRYFMWRTKKGIPLNILVVRDFKSLVNTCEIINKCEALNEYLGQIVFTSESIIRSKNEQFENAFCYMKKEGDSYVLSSVEKPLFI